MLDDAYHAFEESFIIESYESSYATEGSCPPVRPASAPHIKGFCGHPTHQHPLVWESMTQNFEVAEGTLTKSRPSSRPSLPWHSPQTSVVPYVPRKWIMVMNICVTIILWKKTTETPPNTLPRNAKVTSRTTTGSN